jgi:hypothetical protein
MKEKDLTDTTLYFWPYDIFGYLLPGFIVMIPLIEFHTGVRGLFIERFSERSILDALTLIGVAYTLGHIDAALSSLILERFVLKRSHGYPGNQVFLLDPKASSRWKSFLLWLLPGKCHRYPPQFVRRYLALYNRVFHQSVVSTTESRVADDLFWNCSLYASVHHPTGFRIAQHFVELYGFARNTCMALLTIMLYPMIPGWSLNFTRSTRLPNWAWSIGAFLAAYFMYSNYTKLLRRQNDHIFRSFFLSASEDTKVDGADEIILPTSDS